MKKKIIWIALAVVLVVFLAVSAKVIDKGTEGQYTGVTAFDAGASSSDDWDGVVAEVTEKAEDAASLDLKALGDFIATLKNVERTEVLPYHSMGEAKWERLGIPYTLHGVQPPAEDRVRNAEKLLNRK